MLADRFTTELTRLQTRDTERLQARNARDTFIQAQFPVMDTAFSDLVTAATGQHVRLSVIRTTVTDTFTGHLFATLNKTVIELRSTLYGSIEKLRFTPALESVAVDQFGVIKVATEDLPVALGASDQLPLFQSMLDRGVLMRGRDAAHLVVARDNTFVELTGALLEDFLTALFVRTD